MVHWMQVVNVYQSCVKHVLKVDTQGQVCPTQGWCASVRSESNHYKTEETLLSRAQN